MIDLVLFDLDGTLADTVPDIAAALAATLAEVGVPSPPPETVRSLVGDGSRVLIQRALASARGRPLASVRERPLGAELDVDRLLGRFMAEYSRHLCVETRLYPGTADALGEAQRAGVTLAVTTNKPGGLARALLDALGIAGAFLLILGDGDGFPRKPDPAIARFVMARAKTVPAHTAVIGDGVPDVQLARAAGARAIAAGWGYVPADRLRDEAPDLVATTPAEALAFVLSDRASH